MKRNKITKGKDLMRSNRKAIMFNNKEMSAINYYCEKYKINNQSKFFREAIIGTILQKFEDDHPKLFETEQLTLF